MKTHVPQPPLPNRDVLIVDSEAAIGPYLPQLRQGLPVTAVHSWNAAIASLSRLTPALVITELTLDDGSGEEICRAAKSLALPATVLVITAAAERAPGALAAGCDAVLLKPFAPNLLYARIGRLLRARSAELLLQAQREAAKAAHLIETYALLKAGTNRTWRYTYCPYCQHLGVMSFDHASHGRDWYACLACNKVWVGTHRLSECHVFQPSRR